METIFVVVHEESGVHCAFREYKVARAWLIGLIGLPFAQASGEEENSFDLRCTEFFEKHGFAIEEVNVL